MPTGGDGGRLKENYYLVIRYMLQVRLTFFSKERQVSLDTDGQLLPLARRLRVTECTDSQCQSSPSDTFILKVMALMLPNQSPNFHTNPKIL